MRQRLAHDEDGAIALMAVFMAIFLCAVLAYVEGIGAAVVRREQMQDAADALAFSSAALHARGMNVLALLNMLMAALLAVLVALKLLEVLTGIAIVAISVIAFFLPGAAGMIPPLAQIKDGVAQAHDALSPGIHTAIEAMHVAGVGVRTLVPVASQALVTPLTANQPGSPALAGFAVPMRATLPTEDGRFGEICAAAGGYVGDLTHSVIDATPLPDEIAEIVRAATKDLVKSRSDWFCGDGGASPPDTTVTQRHTYPELPERGRCSAIHPDQSGYESAQHALICNVAEQAELDSEPDAKGDCAGPSFASGQEIDCDDARHPYHVRAWLARKDCAPEADDDERGTLKAFQYQTRRLTRRYRFEGRHWKVVSTPAEEQASETRTQRKDVKLRPCGRRYAPIDSAWDDGRDADAAADRTALPPVCSDARPPDQAGREGQLVELEHVEVSRVFGCTRSQKRHYAVQSGAGDGAAQTGQEVPQRVLAGAELGAEVFQIRAGVLGSAPSDRPTRLLRLAARGGERSEVTRAAELAAELGAELGRIAVAQAEYYYDGPEHGDPARYLWSMHWRARLRRFTWPGADADGDTGTGAGATDGIDFDPGELQPSFGAACEAALALIGQDVGGGASVCTQLRDLASSAVH